MRKNIIRKTGISLVFILALGSTLMSKKANAHISRDEDSVPTHACYWIILDPSSGVVGCYNSGTMCAGPRDCVR